MLNNDAKLGKTNRGTVVMSYLHQLHTFGVWLLPTHNKFKTAINHFSETAPLSSLSTTVPHPALHLASALRRWRDHDSFLSQDIPSPWTLWILHQIPAPTSNQFNDNGAEITPLVQGFLLLYFCDFCFLIFWGAVRNTFWIKDFNTKHWTLVFLYIMQLRNNYMDIPMQNTSYP